MMKNENRYDICRYKMDCDCNIKFIKRRTFFYFCKRIRNEYKIW